MTSRTAGGALAGLGVTLAVSGLVSYYAPFVVQFVAICAPVLGYAVFAAIDKK